MIDDVELRLFGGKPSDDSPVPRAQIKFWLDSANAMVLTDWIKRNNEVPSSIVTPIECLLVKTQTSTCISGCETKQYIELPKNNNGQYKYILTLPEDKGVVQVVQGTQNIIRLTNPRQLSMMLKTHFGKQYPYFYRIGGKIYLFNGIFPSFCRLTVYAVIIDTTDMAETDQFPTIDELIPAVTEMAEKIGQRELQGQYDLIDDGIK
jgi:hypothetical protein